MSSATGLSASMAEYVSIHYPELSDLVDAVGSEPFLAKDIPVHLSGNFPVWRTRSVIKRAGRDPAVERDCDGSCNRANERWQWKVHPRVLERVKSMDPTYEGEPLTPCDCRVPKWKNLRDGPFECKLCGEEFEREEFITGGRE